jgi:hypothetical protein
MRVSTHKVVDVSCIFYLWYNIPTQVMVSPYLRLHKDIPQPVDLLWTRDLRVAEKSNLQHTTLIGDKHP